MVGDENTHAPLDNDCVYCIVQLGLWNRRGLIPRTMSGEVQVYEVQVGGFEGPAPALRATLCYASVMKGRCGVVIGGFGGVLLRAAQPCAVLQLRVYSGGHGGPSHVFRVKNQFI